MDLSGKGAIVTGGARGVGRGIVTAFLKAGAGVLIVDREAQLGEASAADLSSLGDVHFHLADLSDRAALPAIIDAAVGRFGKLDILVNAAQASVQKPFMDQTPEDMAIAFDTGFWPTALLMQAAFPHLKQSRGCVINFGSGAAVTAMPTQASYAAAKEAIRSVSKIAAVEWGGQGVRVNVVCPLALSEGVIAWREAFPEQYAGLVSAVPLGRLGDPEADIGAACVFLASDAASFITGQTLMVDGGQVRPF